MEMINGEVEHPFTAKGDLMFNGLAKGDVTVSKGSHVYVNGTVVGNLHVRSTAKVAVNGVVRGDIYNDDGDVTVSGVVNGLINMGTTRIRVAKDAIVRGARVPSDYLAG